MSDNISKLYGVLKDTYELGSESDFRKYLSDGNNRERLRKELESEFDVGDSASFTKYLGFDAKPKQQQTTVQAKKSIQPSESNNQSNQSSGNSEDIGLDLVSQMSLGVFPTSFRSQKEIDPQTGKPVDRVKQAKEQQESERKQRESLSRMMKDQLDYSRATGRPLQNIVPNAITAPTVARDENGNMMVNESGNVVQGSTTDKTRVAQYKQQQKENVRKQLASSIVNQMQQKIEEDAKAIRSSAGFDNGLAPELQVGKVYQGEKIANQIESPERLFELVNSNDVINQALSDNRDVIERGAAELGISVDDFVLDNVIPQLGESIANQFNQNMSEKYSVKDTADYLTRRMGNSIIGTLATMGVTTKMQRQFIQEETEKSRKGEGSHYNSSFGADLLGETLMFAADAPALIVSGGIGGYTTKAVGAGLSKLGATELGAIVSTGSPFLAANVGRATKYGGLAMSSVVRGVGSMSTFMGTSSVIQDLSVGDGTLSSIGHAFLEGAWEGTKFGIATGVFGTASGALGQKVSGVANKLAYNGASFLAENQIFAGLDYIKDPENFNWTESSLDAFYMQIASKFSSKHGIEGVLRSFNNLFVPKADSPIRLSDTDREYIQKSFGGVDFTDIASDVSNIGKILSDKQNIPWVTRQKVSGYVMNTFESSRPRTMRIDIRGKEIREIGQNNELIEVHRFDNGDEALQIRQKIEERRQNDDMLADFALLNTRKNAIPTQQQIENSKAEILNEMLDKDPDFDESTLEEGGINYQFVLDRASEKSNQAQVVVESFANEFGMSVKDVLDIMHKKPIERVDDEADLMTELSKRLHDAAFPQGELHESQSAIDGSDLAGDGPVANPEKNAELSQRVEQAVNEYNRFLQSNDDVREGISQLLNRNPDARADEIMMYIDQNFSGEKRDEGIKVVADYFNALAEKKAYIEKIGQNIDGYTDSEIERSSFSGTLDGAPDSENIITITDGTSTYTLLNGDVGTNMTENGRIIDAEKSGGMMIALDENGQFVSLKPDSRFVVSELMPKEEYANNLREQLGIENTASLVESGLAKQDENIPSTQENGVDDRIGRPLTEPEANDLIASMEAKAEVAPDIEFTPENWIAQFGEDGKVETPIGEVKMGENQFIKLYSRDRGEYFGMIAPTLQSPDIVLEKHAPADGAERDSKYLFIKTFVKPDGSRVVHFESVTVKKDGMEVSISSHEAEGKAIKKEMQNGKILHLSEQLSPSSEWYLTGAPRQEGSDLVPTSDNVSSEGGVIWRTPKDATTPSAERQGLDYEQPNEAEIAAKGSGITPQTTSSADKGTENAVTIQEKSKEISSVTDKDGVKRYEQGIDVDSAIADIQADGFDVNEVADASIAEAQAGIDKINGKDVKSRQDLLKRKQLQDTIAYYNDMKERWSSSQETEREENVNVEAVVPDIEENVVPSHFSGTVEEQKQARIKSLKEELGELFDDDFTKANDVYELVSMWVGRKRNLAWDDVNGKRGLQKELGWTRKIGGDTKFIETLLAKKGEGMGVDEFAHMVWESPENEVNGEKRFDTQEIKDALLDLLKSAQSKSDVVDYAVNTREARAREALSEEQRRAEEKAQQEPGVEPITDEQVAEIENNLPFAGPTDEDIPDSPITKLEKEARSMMEEEGTPNIKVVNTDRMSDDDWTDIASQMYGGAFVSQEDVDTVRDEILSDGVFYNPETGNIIVYSGNQTPEEVRQKVEIIKDIINGRSNERETEGLETEVVQGFDAEAPQGEDGTSKATTGAVDTASEERAESRSVEQPTDNPLDAIERNADAFREEQDRKIGITHEETPEQQADRINEEKLNDEPLTESEIDGSEVSDVQKTLAKAYLKGNHGVLQKAAYLNTYDNVRNRRQDDGTNRTDADGTQLAGTENRGEQGLGRAGRESMVLAETESKVSDEEQRGPLRMEDGEGRLHTAAGERGDNRIPESTSELDGVSSGGEQSGGRGIHIVDGSELGGGQSDIRGSRNTGETAAGSDAAIAASKQRLAALRERFRKAGRKGELGISLVGMNSEQIGILGEIITESANLGYQYLSKGIREFNAWRKQMLEDFHDWLHEDMNWSDAEIDEYLKEVWNCEYNIDGVTRTIGEWSSFMGEENLRNKMRPVLKDMSTAQKDAETISVKTGNIDNIRETLPMLLPEQQEDVLKTETQFFDESHQDRDHGYGKGMMFTNGTGTGKTYTGLGIVKRFVKQGKGRVLILTPSQEKVTDWKSEGLNVGLDIMDLDSAAKREGTSATKTKGEGVVVTTYANARQNLRLLEDCFDLVVYDESHKIMESKEASGTAMLDFHEMLTNKNVERSMDRQTYWLPEWVEMRELSKEADKIRKELDAIGNKKSLTEEQLERQQQLNSRAQEIANRASELRPIMDEIRESKREQAETDSKRTKTVFLSATPFNVRESLRYAEGYLFSFPEEDKSTIGSYNHRSPEDAFFEQYFPAGYRWRYGRLENHVENADALGRQEIDFSDYLQNTLGTMSGRMISSEYDYSRDFPVLTLDHAGRFNQAMSEVYRNKKYRPLAEAFRKSFDYNYSTALFEAMKTSLTIERIKEHLKRGQKVVVFHRRRTSGDLEPPFERALRAASAIASAEEDAKKKTEINNAIQSFREDFADMLEWEKGLDYTLPRNQIANVFGEDKIAFFSGAENKNAKHKSVEDFMKDNGGKDVIVIQEASGKEGISLHDKTGGHQRVEINLALPQSPIAFIQIEGRIYRIGQKSNAIFEYPLLGLDLETSLFAQKFNSALGTTENLALGSKARNLRKSIANAVLENSGEVDYDRQGLGGKDMDGQVESRGTKDGFDVAITDYYGNHKMKSGRENREGVDYFPTPEPIGYKMVEWAQLMEGENALEPSAGHGAIARYVPETNGLTAIEPSSNLFSKLQMRAGGPGRRFEDTSFEDYPLANKHDAVVMNPPYGVQGKTAMEHVAKAFKHLNEGGRLIAIIPDGPAMEKRFDAWLNSTGADGLNGSGVLTGEVKLPDVAFGRAGTNVRTRIVVIDKVSRQKMREGMGDMVHVDLSDSKTVDELFERLRNVNMNERTIDQSAIAKKRALKTRKQLEDNKFVNSVFVDDETLHVVGKSTYGGVPNILVHFSKIDTQSERENLIRTYNRLREARDNADTIDYGRWKSKTFGSGKNAVNGADAVRDYCDTAIKTIANVLKTTEDGLEKEYKSMVEEYDRRHQEEDRMLSSGPEAPIEREKAQPHTAESTQRKEAFEYKLDKNTKTGEDMHLVSMNERVDDNHYKELQRRAKALNGGYYNRYKKAWHFKTEEDARKFAEQSTAELIRNISNGSTRFKETERKDGRTHFKDGNDIQNQPEHVKNIVKSIEKTAKKLNTHVNVVTSVDQVTNEEASKAIREGRNIKGWFDERSGEIVLYMPNITDIHDAERTVAHEVIGHYGMRQLLGDKAFKSYMRTLAFDLKDEKLSEYMRENMARNGFDIYRTIDEFLAEAAENGHGNLTMWQRVKDVMADALRKVGFRMSPSISDAKYMVWLSENNMKKGDPMNAIKRESLLHRLGKERYEASIKDGAFSFGDKSKQNDSYGNDSYFPGTGSTMFRSTPSTKTAKYLYERALKNIGYAWKESHIDKMQGAIELMRAMSGVNKIEDIPSVENFVLAENQISSKEEQLDFMFNRDFMKPLDKAVSKILPDMGRDVDDALRNLQLYMIKKHGLERNRALFVRDRIREYRKDPNMDQNAVDHLENAYNNILDAIRMDIRNGIINFREYLEQIDAFIQSEITPNYIAGEHDYSGLTSIKKGSGKSYDDNAIIDEVMSTESMIGEDRINELWERTKALGQYGLDMEYEGGLDSKDSHDKVGRMFEWYVPLRGYDETTSEEVYDYLNERSQGGWAGPVLMNAEGRKSLSDVDVFATMAKMNTDAISRALRNQMKQTFARFVRNHYDKDGDDRLVTEMKYLWGEKVGVDTSGNEIWEERFPDIPENAKADDVAKIVKDFEDDMKAKESQGLAKKMRQKTSIPFRPVNSKDKSQHIVEVYINGEKKVFVVNGNPRAAQAINGQLNAESNHKSVSKIVRMMAQLNTSYNPDFIVGNTERDFIFSSAAIFTKENAGYLARWEKNYFTSVLGREALGVPGMHTNLFKRYRNNSLDMNNETDRYFKEFMENGGETGWVEHKNLEKWKKQVRDGVRTKGTPEKIGRSIVDAIPEAIEAMNERAENMARFATYMTSRQSGRSVVRSVSDAKEISVNFNRKGAGLKTQGLGKNDRGLRRMNAIVAARTAQYGQDYLMFYNAGVQGLNNAAKLFRDHPIKASTAFAGFALGAIVMSQLNQFLINDEDPKERGGIQNPYAELPEWIRRNRLCLYIGGGEFATVDLPIELRALYGIGDIAASYTLHPELRSDKPVWQDVLTQMTQIMPVDFMGEHPGEPWMNFVPSMAMPIAEILMNQNWYGRKIEKDQYINENDPRWKRAYSNTNKAYIEGNKQLNAATNRYSEEVLENMGISPEDVSDVDASIRGKADGKFTDPSFLEHIANGYTGGFGQTIGRIAHIYKALGEENIGDIVKSNQMPIVRRLHYSPTEQNKLARTRNRWYRYKEEMESVENETKILKKAGVSDPISKMKQISLEDSARATRAELMKGAQKDYKRLKKKYDNEKDAEKKDSIQMRMDQLMENTVNGLDSIR